MKWIITIDCMDSDQLNTTGIRGKPSGGIPFRLLDCDDIVYFYGMAEEEFCRSEEGFEPLDELGEDYGCTSIEYFEEDGWVVL